MKTLFTMLFCLLASVAQATNYYISPIGSNSNNGLSTAAPWLTFAHALANGWGCGDTLILVNGTYGDGTSTGRPSIQSVNCTVNTRMVMQALNERQAYVFSDGSNSGAMVIQNSSYITLHGIRFGSAQNQIATAPNCTSGNGVYTQNTHHLLVRFVIIDHNNRYCNSHLWVGDHMEDSLFEDVELYYHHRHAIFQSGIRNTYRRVYCNGRGWSSVTGGYNSGAGAGRSATCVSLYPGTNVIIENVLVEGGTGNVMDVQAACAHGYRGDDNLILGSVALDGNVATIKARPECGLHVEVGTPKNNIVRHSVGIGSSPFSFFISTGARNFQCINCSTFNTVGNAIHGILSTYETCGATSGNCIAGQFIGNRPFTSFVDNSLVVNHTAAGTYGIILNSTYIDDYLVRSSDSFNNANSFFPAIPNAKNTNPQTIDPQFGTCRMWVPDSSPMKGDGVGGADIGANILYRYVDGVLTNVPLWDPTTGAFPRGALVTGLNDVAGGSLFDFHTRNRINVNTGGCSFPSGYAGNAGGDPDPGDAEYVSGQGTTSSSHQHELPAGTDAVSVAVALHDVEANVGSVSAVSVCGNAASLIPGATATVSAAGRRTEIWGYAPGAPNTLSGSCTIAVTTTGAVDAVIATSGAFADAEAFGAGVGTFAMSGSPTITVTANVNELVIDSLATSKSVSLSSGPNQTLHLDTPRSTSSTLRGAVSSQAGSDGGVMSYTLGGSVYWALAAATVVPQGGGTPPDPVPVLTQTKFRFHGFYGAEDAPIAQGAMNTDIKIIPTGMVRLRMELTASAADYPLTGMALFCNHNGGAYAQAQDTFGANVFRLFGPGANPDLPSSLASTTQQLSSGNFVAGAVLRSTSAAFTVTVPEDNHTEIEWVLALNAAAGDTVACRIYKDNGSAIDTYTVTPTLTVVPMAAGGGM